jgi:spore maturation protein B
MMHGMAMIGDALFLLFVIGIPCWGVWHRLQVYHVFIKGAKDGFQVMIDIVPYLVAMLVVIGMVRASGAFRLLAHLLHPLLTPLSVPDSILPLFLVRPFSGSASLAVLADIIHHYGANSYDAFLAATALGSSETTFYVIAVYFGAANIVKTRYAVGVGLIADFAGFVASCIICRLLYTG